MVLNSIYIRNCTGSLIQYTLEIGSSRKKPYLLQYPHFTHQFQNMTSIGVLSEPPPFLDCVNKYIKLQYYQSLHNIILLIILLLVENYIIKVQEQTYSVIVCYLRTILFVNNVLACFHMLNGNCTVQHHIELRCDATHYRIPVMC